MLLALVACELMMVLGYLATQAFEAVPWGPLWHVFNLDREATLPAWFSGVQLFAIGCALIGVAQLGVETRRFLMLAGIAFVCLSADEVVGLHELFSRYVAATNVPLLRSLGYEGHGTWMLPYAVVGGSALLVSVRPVLWLWRRYRSACVWVLVGGVVMVTSVPFELFSYVYLRGDETAMPYLTEVALEEFCEMLGASLILFGVMRLGLAMHEPVAWADAASAEEEGPLGAGI